MKTELLLDLLSGPLSPRSHCSNNAASFPYRLLSHFEGLFMYTPCRKADHPDGSKLSNLLNSQKRSKTENLSMEENQIKYISTVTDTDAEIAMIYYSNFISNYEE